jgi:hypothetical protein
VITPPRKPTAKAWVVIVPNGGEPLEISRRLSLSRAKLDAAQASLSHAQVDIYRESATGRELVLSYKPR